MKNLVLVLASAFVLLTGCNKDDFHAIFDGSDKDVVSPIDFNALGTEDIFHSGDFSYILAYEVLKNLYGEDKAANGQYGEGRPELAHVINNSSILLPIEAEGKLYKWPEIDFSKYSLVIGQYTEIGDGYVIVEQRAKISREKTQIYLKRVQDGKMRPQSPISIAFVALYPKLPDGSAEVISIRQRDN